MSKPRSKPWFFRTGEVVTIVGVKPTDMIDVYERTVERSGVYDQLLDSKQVKDIGQVHPAGGAEKPCRSSKKYKGTRPPSCNGNSPCAACQAVWNKKSLGSQ